MGVARLRLHIAMLRQLATATRRASFARNGVGNTARRAMSDITGDVIGIDRGTTNSCVATMEGSSARVIENAEGMRTTPSVCSFTDDGQRLVGLPAKRVAVTNPKNTLYATKRLIGRKFDDAETQSIAEHVPYKIVKASTGDAWVEAQGEQYSPSQVGAFTLSKMKETAEGFLGRPVGHAVVTVPAYFNDSQRQATKDAGKIAGLEVARIINEPTAAALAYGLHSAGAEGAAANDKANVLIFDLGGGTFDVSILSMEGGVFAVKATGGDTHLGGEDFDQAIVDWCHKEIESKVSKSASKAVKSNNKALQRLRRAVEAAKRNLSTSESSDIELEQLIDGSDFSTTLTRATFEKICDPLFKRCIDTVKAVITDAGATVDTVSDVVLVGGSTRVLALQDRLNALFGGRVELSKNINPDEAVAYGAAVQGAIIKSGGSGGGLALDGISSDLVLLDVTPLSLGIELEGRVMSVLIPRNTPIPCVKSREYTTCEDWQTEIDVVVFEGERPQTSANNKLGEFKISGIQRAKRGEPKVEVTFSLDSNGILAVSAMDKVTGAKANAEIRADRGRLTDTDIERMIADAERYREEDLALARKIHFKNAFEEAVYSLKSNMTEKNDISGISDLDEVLTWLEYDSESASYEELQRKADQLYTKFGYRVDASRRMEA